MAKIPYEGNVMEKEKELQDKQTDDTDNEKDKESAAEDKNSPWEKENTTAILSQIKKERELAWRYLKPKHDKWLRYLKLYNNQRRSQTAVGDPLLFTVHQTVLASLYNDTLSVDFLGREEGDAEQAENLTLLAQFDYDAMKKSQIDYDWDWDTCFFGWSLVLFMEFDRKTKTPMPEVIDPFTVLRDPNAVSPNGDVRGRGAARFLGREMRMCKYQMKKAGVYKHIDDLKCDEDKVGNEPLQQAVRERQQAQGYTEFKAEKLEGDSEEHVLLEWFTVWNGERWFFTVGNHESVLVRAQKVEGDRWPFIKRNLFPIAHDWDGVSLCDLVEDKQRSRARLINLGLKGATANLYPNYLYDNTRILNKGALAKFEFNKFTGVAGNPQGAVVEIPRSRIANDVQWILGMLDAAAQQATATPDIKQGVAEGAVRSATETAQVTKGVDTRYGLAAKIWFWSETDFWDFWYCGYKKYYKDFIDEKVIRIAGALGATWRKFSRDQLVGAQDPDIKIQSKALSDAKRMNRLNVGAAFMNQGVALDESFNKRFALRQMGKDIGYSTDELNRYLPKTLDEYEAEGENELLSGGKAVKVQPEQNHVVHIEIHSKAADTKAKAIHIAQHRAMMFVQRRIAAKQAEQAAAVAAAQGQAGGGGGVNPTTGQAPSPMEKGTAPAPRDMAQSPIQMQVGSPAQILS